MKKLIHLLLAVCLLLSLLPGAAATEVQSTEPETTQETIAPEEPSREAGQCGSDLHWSFENGTLTVSGTGEMDDYPDGDAPWLMYRDSMTKVVFSGGVTYIGEGAFTDYDGITDVDFGASMHTIGVEAFKSCDGLTSITLPASFRRFGKECFMSCENLKNIYCKGGMPSFNGNCLWDTYCTVFYPTNNPWPVEPVTQLYQAFQGRVEFFMGGETAQPVAVTEPVQTQPAETIPPTTVPETTVAVTQPETVATEAPTEAPTQAPTTQPTQPEWLHETYAQEETAPEKGSGVMAAIAIIAGTLSLLLIGALVFRRRRY